MRNSNRVEVKLLPPNYSLKQVTIHGRIALDCVGSYAHAISQTLAVHCVPADAPMTGSENYQPFRMLTPQEVATRACDIAQALYDEMAARGMTHDIPPIDQLEDERGVVGFQGK